MTWLAVWPHNEASSGTSPTTVADAQSSPLNLTITYGGADAWATYVGGKGLQYINATRAKVAIGSTKLDIFGGTRKVASGEVFGHWSNGDFGRGLSILGGSGQNIFTIYRLDGGNSGGAAGSLQFYCNSANQRGTWALPGSLSQGQLGHHFLVSVNTTLATAVDRSILYLDGFKFANTGNNHAQNDVLGTFASPEVVIGAASAGGEPWDGVIGGAGVADHDVLGPEALDRALHWFGDNDTEPIATGARLLATGGAGIRGGSANGGTTDASTSSSAVTVGPTIDILSASGANRAIVFGVSAYAIGGTGVTTCKVTISGTDYNASKITGQTSALASTADVEWWWLNDAAMPPTAQTAAPITVTTDGSSTLAVTPIYLEGVNQSTPTNFGAATGTSTSITANMASSPAAGSILVACLFDLTIADVPVAGANQLPISTVTGTSTGSTHRHVTCCKYVPTSGAQSISYSSLTNTTGKILLAVEFAVASTVTNVSTGRSDETDTGQTCTVKKTLTTGRADGTNTALACTLKKTAAAGRSNETDAAQALTLSHSIATGRANETDAAQGLTVTKGVTVGRADATDAAQARTLTKLLAVGRADGTNAAQAPGLVLGFSVASAVESDAALPRTWTKYFTTGRANETGSAHALSLGQPVDVGLSVETSVALSLALSRALATGRAEETDASVAISFPLTVSAAAETDVAVACVFTAVAARPFWERFQDGFNPLLDEISRP